MKILKYCKSMKTLTIITFIFLSLVLGLESSGAQEPPNPSDIIEVSWSPSGDRIAIGHFNGGIDILDASNGTVLLTLAGHSDAVFELAWKPDGTQLASGSQDTTVRVWDMTNGNLLHTLIAHDLGISALIWTPDGTKIVSATGFDEQLNLRVWDAAAGTLLDSKDTAPIADFAWNQDGTILAGAGTAGVVIFLSGTTFEFMDIIINEFLNGEVKWSLDDNFVISGSNNSRVTVWDVATGQAITNVLATDTISADPSRIDKVREFNLNADNTELTTIAADGTVRIWNVSTGTLLSESQITGPVFAAEFSPDGSQLAFGGEGTTIQIIPAPQLNQAPTANAGFDQTVTDSDNNGSELVTLDGSLSSDADGTIVSYAWSEGGVSLATGVTPMVTLAVGAHTLTLTVTDDDGATASDDVVVTINPPTITCDFNIAVADSAGLIAAINTANSNGVADTICLANSTYTFTTPDNVHNGANALPVIMSDITIEGNGATLTRAVGAPAMRFFEVSAGRLALANLTLNDGLLDSGNGGAIFTQTDLSLDTTTISNASSRFGGGVYVAAGTLSVNGSTFNQTTAIENGGGLFLNSGTMTVTGSTFNGGSARFGGGIYVNNGITTVTNNNFSNHVVTEQGGGIFFNTGTLTLNDSSFDNNSARFGGGLYANSATVTVDNSTFANHVVAEQGGGIFYNNGTLTISNSSFDNNSARFGGGIFSNGSFTVGGSIFTNNSVVEQGGGVFTNSAGSNTVDNSCFNGNTGRFGGGLYSSALNFMATNNWWGAADGPSEAGSGTGDAVNSNVIVIPFLSTEPAFCVASP